MVKFMENVAMAELIANLTIINNQNERQSLIEELRLLETCKTVAFLNTRALKFYIHNEEFRAAILNADYLLLDGIGISLLAKSLKLDVGINMNGTDFIPDIISSPKLKKIAIFGSTDAVIKIAKGKLEKIGKKIVAHCNGYYEDAHYLRVLRLAQADVVLLAMGMPKQELISNIMSSDTQITSRLIICSGGFLDFFSGVKPRAPRFIVKMRLEWLYRFLLEPARMLERNLYNIKIIFVVCINTLKGKI